MIVYDSSTSRASLNVFTAPPIKNSTSVTNSSLLHLSALVRLNG